MMRILFVCHGNICRSSAAEYILKDLASKKGVSSKFVIASCGTSSEEFGNPMYYHMAKELDKHGIHNYKGHHACVIERSDYDSFDLIFGMDNYNIRNLKNMFKDSEGKISLLGSLTGVGEIEDPWYTERFGLVYDQIYEACLKILEICEENNYEGFYF